jgi:hypothetical protein
VNVVGGRFIREAKVRFWCVMYQQICLGKLVWMCCEWLYVCVVSEYKNVHIVNTFKFIYL